MSNYFDHLLLFGPKADTPFTTGPLRPALVYVKVAKVFTNRTAPK